MHFPLPFFAVPNYFWNFWNNFFELKASKRHISELNKTTFFSNSPVPCTPSRACRRARASWSWTRSCSCALSTCAWNQNRTLVQWLSARNLSLNFFKKRLHLHTYNQRNLCTRTSMSVMVLKIFWAKKSFKKPSDRHPRQGILLHRNIFTGLSKTSLRHTT
jgi:hypothetical protein